MRTESISIGLGWALAVVLGPWYYLTATREIWQGDVHVFYLDWLPSTTALGVFGALFWCASNGPARKLLGQVPWALVPWILGLEIARLVSQCVTIFYAQPSWQTFSTVSMGGGILLWVVLVWILLIPLDNWTRPFPRLRAGLRFFFSAIGLALAILIFKGIVHYFKEVDFSPDARILTFIHNFQRMGVFLLLLLFLRIFLPVTLVKLFPGAIRRLEQAGLRWPILGGTFQTLQRRSP